MELSDLRRELGIVLPEGHPILQKWDTGVSRTTIEDPIDQDEDALIEHENEIKLMLAELVDVIDDWKRGLRDWSEVERKLIDAREEIR